MKKKIQLSSLGHQDKNKNVLNFLEIFYKNLKIILYLLLLVKSKTNLY